MKKLKKVLFICKKRNDSYGPSYGLINSCKFISNALEDNGIESKVVDVIDNNYIDREVHNFKPTHVFIEAIWVVPEKIKVLLKLYPKIQWYVRIHSKIPFISNEGIAIGWLREYGEISKVYKNFSIAANNEEISEAFYKCYKIKIEYFPNIYHPKHHNHHYDDEQENNHCHEECNSQKINIGCFGSIRPLKNQLIQAMAAIAFGNQLKCSINFHVNGNRCEQNGDNVLKNLINSFKNTPHNLICHPWLSHSDFVNLVKKMDLGLQVSISETFNIVAADFAWNNVPIVGSDEISWLDRRYKANPNSLSDITDKLHYSFLGKKHNIQKFNLENLQKFNKKATKIWLHSL